MEEIISIEKNIGDKIIYSDYYRFTNGINFQEDGVKWWFKYSILEVGYDDN